MQSRLRLFPASKWFHCRPQDDYIRILLEAVSVLQPSQIVDQRFCRFEIGRLEPLGKLAINRREQLTVTAALLALIVHLAKPVL